MTLFLEQCLNGLQFGLLLFLLAAGLTLVFGIMDLVNLAHGSLYMVGAYFAATFSASTGSFIVGAVLALAGLAGLMQAPILTVQIGMGENILILAFVVTVIGGIGSIRGALVAALLVGVLDTLGRAFFPDLLRTVLSTTAASALAPALSSMLIYLLMAIVLVIKPAGLFAAGNR
jgi:branched-subunit amino acid ABC-type transport system permease component